MATTQPTAEQWKEIEERVMSLYSPIWLDCDGYLVRLMLERVEKLRLGIGVRVNGSLDLAWLGIFKDDQVSDEGRRFFQRRTRSVWQGKSKKHVRRAFGKKEAEKKSVHHHPWWESPTSMRRHLVANNESIRLLDAEEAKARLEALQKEAS